MNTPNLAATVETDHLARLNALKKHDPYIYAIFVGWMCGTASRQRLNPTVPQSTVAEEVEAFLTQYESSAAGPSS